LDHWHHLHTTDQGWLSVSQGVGSISLFLLTAAKLLPRTSRLLLGDLEFTTHLPEQVLSSRLVLLGQLGGG
jgi:hypothetical protein